MRKIGILTYQNTTNFGAALQCYGLYKKIFDLGGDVEVIDYHSEEIEGKEIPYLISKPRGIIKRLKHQVSINILEKKYQAMSDFMRDNIHYSESVNKTDISRLNDRYDVFVSGSDILWDKKINGGDYTYFLDFVRDDKEKYSYATSVADNWDKSDEVHIKKLLTRYQKIATREKSGVEWVERITKGRKTARFICDPTMLITKEEWIKIARKSSLWEKLKEQKYVLIYFCNDDVLKLAQKYAADNHMNVYEVNLSLRPLQGRKKLRLYSISDFLAAVYCADFVVTASYHGMLFSLYFERQFRYFGRRPRTRMDHVAEIFNIEFTDGDLESKECIDYEKVSKKIEEYRNEGIDYINRNIIRSSNDNV